MAADLPDFDIRLGAALRELRIQRGLSLPDVADEIGVTYQQLQKYEAGRNSLSVRRLLQMADLLGVEPRLLMETGDPKCMILCTGESSMIGIFGERHRLRKAYFSLPEHVRLAFLRLLEGEADRRA